MKDIFDIAAGTVTGRSHRETGKNNQDAYYYKSNDSATIAVVCDGCSEGKNSEIGAKIGAKVLVDLIVSYLSSFLNPELIDYKQGIFPFWGTLQYLMTEKIKEIAREIYFDIDNVIKEYFLFTIVGAIITGKNTAVFSVGDGIVFINNEIINIGPFPNNEPPYIGYQAMNSDHKYKNPDWLKFRIHEEKATQDIDSILIGTDGIIDLIDIAGRNMPGKEQKVGPINQFWEEEKYFKNSDMIRRKLFLVNKDVIRPRRDSRGNIKELIREPGLLPDDTTLIVLRRRE